MNTWPRECFETVLEQQLHASNDTIEALAHFALSLTMIPLSAPLASRPNAPPQRAKRKSDEHTYLRAEKNVGIAADTEGLNTAKKPRKGKGSILRIRGSPACSTAALDIVDCESILNSTCVFT